MTTKWLCRRKSMPLPCYLMEPLLVHLKSTKQEARAVQNLYSQDQAQLKHLSHPKRIRMITLWYVGILIC